jgi:hypothetical protein
MAVICVSFRQEGHVRPVYVKSNLDSQCSQEKECKTPNFSLLPITQDTNILLCKYHEPLYPVNQLCNMSSYMVE